VKAKRNDEELGANEAHRVARAISRPPGINRFTTRARVGAGSAPGGGSRGCALKKEKTHHDRRQKPTCVNGKERGLRYCSHRRGRIGTLEVVQHPTLSGARRPGIGAPC
jgi:hypothetical protein